MLLSILKYKIIITLENLVTNNLDNLTKYVTRRNIQLEKGTPIQIDKKNLVDYFSREIRMYCEKNNVRKENLTLYGYEIESKTDNIEVYFQTDDDNLFVNDPAIMACLTITKDMPTLKATQLNSTTIKWEWDLNDDIQYLKSDKDEIIYQVPIGINYYIEADLTPGETYTRYLTAVNAIHEELQSLPCSLTLIEEIINEEYPVFEVQKRDETVQELDLQYPSKLKAFASGVGDFNDCKLYKSDDTSLSRKFNLYNKIYGVRASNDIKHHTIKFTYRYKLVGVQDYISYNAKFTIKATAQECVPLEQDPDQTTYGNPISSKSLTFTLDDKTMVANIYLYQLFPGLLQQDYKKRYKYTVNIYDTEGRAVVYSYNYGGRQIDNNSITFSEHGFFDHMFTVAAIATKKQKEYIEYYPSKQYDALMGNINGDFEESTDGIKNLHCIANSFDTSPSVYNKKYYVEFETISPDSGYVQYEWDHQVPNTTYTEINGDGITFFSNAIFADNSEHREFITQTEIGPYEINDNRLHKINYRLQDVKVNLNNYIRFELDIKSSNNDITIISETPELIIDEEGNIDMPVEVSCRHLQSAIAKWSPSIHNGYYYYNQNEYFLYSKCVPDGKNLSIEERCIKRNVNILISLKETSDKQVDKTYEFNLKTKKDLLLDDYHYEWDKDKVWPKAIETWNSYYQQFAPVYEYYTQPFVFDAVPTKYNTISWEEAGTPKSTIEVYAIAYNDIYGIWYDPVRIYSGQPIPSELHLSKILILKFVLKPSRLPVLKTRTFLYDCESDWKNQQYNYLTNNAYYLEETLMPTSHTLEGEFVSKFIDLGDTIEEVKKRTMKFNPTYEGEIEFYIMDADTEEELNSIVDYNNWRKVGINEVVSVKRFARYMIKLLPKSKLFYMELVVQRYETNCMEKEEYLPGFGNVKIEAECKGSIVEKYYSHTMTYNLLYDTQDHELISDLRAYLNNLSDTLGFTVSNINKIEYVPTGDYTDFTVKENDNVVYIKSNNLIEDDNILENSQGGAIYDIVDNTLTLSPIPQQYAPIIIYADGVNEPLIQVFFTDDDNNYILTNTEEFESYGFKTLYLKYLNIDIESLKIEFDNEINTDYNVIDNVVVFDDYVKKGTIIKVTYKLLNSFVANYDFMKDSYTIDFHKNSTEDVHKIKLFYETNKLSACRQLNNISLNPIYNSRYYGYIYICDYQDPPQTVKIYPASNYIYANGLDTMNLLVQVLDKNKNPVENVKVSIAAAKGSITAKNEKTDINGVIHCIYTATNDDYIDTIKAVVTDDVKDETKIYNRKL